LIQFVIPEFSHRVLVSLKPFKASKELWVKKLTFVNSISGQGMTTTLEALIWIGGKVVNPGIAFGVCT
jgi:hypothetical protein